MYSLQFASGSIEIAHAKQETEQFVKHCRTSSIFLCATNYLA